MIKSDIETLPNRNKYIWAEFSIMKEREDRMTINKLAREMREGFKHLDAKIENVRQEMNTMKVEINTRLDKIEKRLDEHDTIFARNNLR